MSIIETVKFVIKFAVQNPLLVVKALVSAYWRASLPRKIVIAAVLWAIYKLFFKSKVRLA